MKVETVHKFDEKGKLVLPDTRHLGKLISDRHDQLAQATRDRNWNVTKDIVAYHKEVADEDIDTDALINNST